jgi:hypothetical protein
VSLIAVSRGSPDRPRELGTQVARGGERRLPDFAVAVGTPRAQYVFFIVPAARRWRDLLKFFFQIHDPTTLNRQGNDVGRSYRSAIFYTSDEQKQVALDTIADVDTCGLWPGKVVTEVAAAGRFWEAEPEHQTRPGSILESPRS